MPRRRASRSPGRASRPCRRSSRQGCIGWAATGICDNRVGPAARPASHHRLPNRRVPRWSSPTNDIRAEQQQQVIFEREEARSLLAIFTMRAALLDRRRQVAQRGVARTIRPLDLPVFVLTTSTAEPVHEEALRAGADKVFVKPDSADALSAIAAEIVQRGVQFARA